MTAQELFSTCQGNMSLRRFARQLKISKSALSLILSGKRHPGPTALRNLAQLFPERKDEIVGLFLLENVHNIGQYDHKRDDSMITQESVA